MDLAISGNSAIVIASSSGLGKAAAESLLKEGVSVIINGRDEKRLQESADELKKLQAGRVIAVQGDITKKEDLKKIVQTAVDEYGRIDHLVTSAGGPPSLSFLDSEEEDWYYAFDLLLMSVVRLVKEAFPYLKKDGGGTIVNITSISVKEAINDLVLSNSVRMAVIGLMKTLSKELAPELRANAVLSGFHETKRVQDLFEKQIADGKFQSYEQALDSKRKNIPLQKIGSPAELGDLIAFLSSPKSSYINGSSIVIDGGSSASNL
ncbi:SDR family oxidoreductase [Halanaerobium hydrogeniformans]|uniref:Short-chain dehydrogenase/reductase SDR n=1 Tax=Halanaerobium hydrogeniformans TaxID=656519 RepID=E4RPA4_HALHG|nr:SDR family oxidoreductase [Halanaerobium hydrogeniformans]ADQ13789.1 short-chain dehydrogenase/reductase SDR [Halanaerobium hydrogeniformans]